MDDLNYQYLDPENMPDLLDQIKLYLQQYDPTFPLESDGVLSELKYVFMGNEPDMMDGFACLPMDQLKIKQLEKILEYILIESESRKHRVLKLLKILRSRKVASFSNSFKKNVTDFQDHPDNHSLTQENRDTVRRRAKALAGQSGIDLSRAAIHTVMRWEVAAGRSVPAQSILGLQSRLRQRICDQNNQTEPLSPAFKANRNRLE